jgi:integrase/recombinase XerD
MQLVDVVEQFLMDCENRGRAAGTIAMYQRRLGLLLRWLAQQGVTELEAVTLAHLRHFQNFLMHSEPEDRYEHVAQRGKLEPSTLASYVGMIRAFFQWCVNEELIASNPAARLKKPKVPQKVVPAFTAEQVEQLLAVCDTETRYGFRNYVMILVFLDTGMRVSELCSLRLSDVHPRYVKVQGKGEKEREIGIHPDVSKLLWKYVNKYRPGFGVESEYVFVGEKGPLTVNGIESIFDRIERDSGVTGLRVAPHTLRHTHSKEYLKSGGDLFKLSRELGHSSVQVTGNVYLSDFKSADAREDHDEHSPVKHMRIGQPKGRMNGKKQKGGK